MILKNKTKKQTVRVETLYSVRRGTYPRKQEDKAELRGGNNEYVIMFEE